MKKNLRNLICALCAMALMLGMAVPAFAAGGYVDVPDDEWYAEVVEYVTENGMMQGVGNNCFDPEGTTTRGMIAVVLHRHAGTPTAWGNIFADVSEQDWYCNAASWCHGRGIVKGYSLNIPPQTIANYSHRFKGEQAVTREELACFLYRYAKYAGADVSEVGSLEGFADAASVSDWAVESMGWCVANGIIQGTPEGESLNLAPASNATRAEVAAMLMRYCELIEE